MRINKIVLQAYGHFTDKTIDFTGQDKKLNIIFGPNEAGKSTVMRALDAFFFGFGHTSPDAFVHSYKDLAVRMEIKAHSGTIYDLTRFKRKTNDLVDQNGQAVLPETLNRIMSGLSRDMYANMFGLDHENVRHGAQEIFKAGGHLGETLFAAASGVNSLRSVLDTLRRQADALFKPRAHSRPVWQNIQNISELNKKLMDKTTRPEDWNKIKSILSDLYKDRQALEQEISDLEAKLHGYDRIYKALPHISKHTHISGQLADLINIPKLSSDFTSKRTRIQTRINSLIQDKDNLEKDAHEYSRQLSSLTVNNHIIGLAPAIEHLYQKISGISDSRENISSIELEINLQTTLLEEKSAFLSRQIDDFNTEEFRIDHRQVRAVEKLVKDLAMNTESLDQIARDIQETQQDQTTCSQQLDSFPSVPDIKQLDSLSDSLSRARELQDQQKQAQSRIKKLTTRINNDLKTLQLWDGDLEQLTELTLPLAETIDVHDQKITQARQDMDYALKEMNDTEQRMEQVQWRLNSLDPDQSLPDPDALSKARALRSQGWEIIKSIWLNNIQEQEKKRKFLDVTGADNLSTGFEYSISRADEIADTLLKNADQVASRAGLLLEIQNLQNTKHRQEAALHQKELEYQQAMTEWTELWTPLKISPLSPREMGAWTSKVKEILIQAQDLHSKSLDMQTVQNQIQTITTDAAQKMRDMDQKIPDDIQLESLSLLLSTVRENAQKLVTDKQNLEYHQNNIQKKLRKLEQKKDELTGQLEKNQAKWHKTMSRLNIDPGQDPEEARDEISIRQEIFQALTQIDKLKTQKQGEEKKCSEFARQTSDLLEQTGLSDETSSAPEMILGNIYQTLKSEQEQLRRKKDLETRLQEVQQKSTQANKEIRVLNGELAILMQEAMVSDPVELPDVEHKSALKKELESELKHLSSQLRELSAGESLKQFMAKALEFDIDELSGIISGIKDHRAEKKSQLEPLIIKITENELKLKSMDGSSDVPELEQQIAEQKAILEDNVQHYVTLKLASDIMAAEIERYRSANQGPVLEKAGQIFQEITLGAFKSIMADYDEKGEPVIKAVKPSGSGLLVEELSDGTRDQLFLALRLSGIYRYLDENPAFPFMADDILVHFDNERSSRTLSTLSQMADKTQVFFFTHHRHLIDLAMNIPENNMVELYELA